LGLPETTGLAVLGGTIGALLGGVASGKFDLAVMLGALAGAALPFVATRLPRLDRSDRT